MVLHAITAIRRMASAIVVTAFAASIILMAPVPALAQLHTEIKPTMPDLGLGNTNADDSPVVCRPPQPQTDSRLLGPRVCRTQRQWDDLHKQGLDVSADGRGVVASEKYRSTNPLACGSNGSCGP